MKNPIAIRLLCVAALVVPAVDLAAPLAQQGTRYDEFTTKFHQALAIADYEEMAKLVKIYHGESVLHIDFIGTQIATGSSEALEKEMAALMRSWKEAMKTGFAEWMYQYCSLLDPQRKAERKRLVEAYNSALKRFEENRTGPKAGPTFELVSDEFRVMAGAFKEIGDAFYAARCWSAYGICFDESNRGKDANLRKACEGLGKAVAAWESIGMNAADFVGVKQRWELLVANGWAQPEPDPNAPHAGDPVATANALTLPMSFKPLASLSEVERPSYFADEIYQVWHPLYMRDIGSTAVFPAMEKSPRVMRTAPSAVQVDVDADGKGDVEVPVTGNMNVVHFAIGAGDQPREWAFVSTVGIEQDNYQGLRANLSPAKDVFPLYCFGAASVIGMVGEVPVRVIDDNLDGVYGSPPKLWGHVGLSEGLMHPEVDSIVVGESKRARPWSEFQKIGEQWYQLESLGAGTELKATPVTLETGTVRLECKGETPEWLVLQGKGKHENSFFDIADAKKGAELPAGTWMLHFGILRKGKKQQTTKALILPGESMQEWNVQPGKETVVKLGAPYSFAFQQETSGTKLRVKGRSVTVVGVSGERYERTWGCVPRPEMAWRKAGSRRASKPEKMPVVLDLDELKEDGTRLHDYADCWRPLDLEIELKKDEGPLEVQLVEKKNKLFGSIESDWK